MAKQQNKEWKDDPNGFILFKMYHRKNVIISFFKFES